MFAFFRNQTPDTNKKNNFKNAAELKKKERKKLL